VLAAYVGPFSDLLPANEARRRPVSAASALPDQPGGLSYLSRFYPVLSNSIRSTRSEGWGLVRLFPEKVPDAFKSASTRVLKACLTCADIRESLLLQQFLGIGMLSLYLS
jgi:hypothetical protein